MDLSVILPCYNEAGVLQQTVRTIQQLLDKTVYDYEIVIAEDGSTDGTDTIAKELAENFRNVVWMHGERRLGWGAAVANAVKKSRRKIVGFLDPDLEGAAHYILPLVMEIEKGADIASGIRCYKVKPLNLLLKFPKLLSHYGYLWVARRLLRVRLNDTEVGYKFFNRERILPLLDEIKNRHWFWATEIMVRAYYKGYKIKEIPIIYVPDYTRESKVDLLKDGIAHFKNLMWFRRELKNEIRNKKINKLQNL